MSSHSDRPTTFPPVGRGAINPLALLVPILIVGAIVFMLRRRTESAVGETSRDRRKESDTPRKMILTLAINAIENDMARRVVVMGLKMARSRM